ncbi:hypothetical protein ACVI1N_006387 [Sinorhizobium medicae]
MLHERALPSRRAIFRAAHAPGAFIAVAGLAFIAAPAVTLRARTAMVLLGFVVAVAFRTTVLARSTMIAALVLLRTVVAQQFVAGEAAGCRLALWPIPARSALALSCAIAAGPGVAATAASLGRAGLVGRNFSAGDGNLDAHQLFNIAQQPDFVRGAKGDRNTVAAVSGRAADTVDISVGHLRQVVVVDMRHAGNVNAACGDIGRHEYPDFTIAEGFQSALSLALALVAVDRGGLETGPGPDASSAFRRHAWCG